MCTGRARLNQTKSTLVDAPGYPMRNCPVPGEALRGSTVVSRGRGGQGCLPVNLSCVPVFRTPRAPGRARQRIRGIPEPRRRGSRGCTIAMAPRVAQTKDSDHSRACLASWRRVSGSSIMTAPSSLPGGRPVALSRRSARRIRRAGEVRGTPGGHSSTSGCGSVGQLPVSGPHLLSRPRHRADAWAGEPGVRPAPARPAGVQR